ncbi:MAG: hypothetical protein GX589_05555, partial [Deltaproteobacteria bacterium]|nr:hypothetical protein [Deltaproteobacteria bacterium]
MMKCSAAIPVMLLLCLTAIKPADCQQTESSQIRPSQAGVIELQAPPKEETPQENLLDYFNTFAQQLDRLADGQLSNVPKLDENSVLYLNAVYLFCSLRKGACPWILEALLETDIVNSRLNKSPDCPQMRSFWKLWGKNDLQRRHDYQI